VLVEVDELVCIALEDVFDVDVDEDVEVFGFEND